MKKLWMCSLLVLAFAWVAAQAQAETVLAVGSAKSVNALIEKAENVAEVAEQDMWKAAIGTSKFLFTEKGPVGMILDTSRPAGLVVYLCDGECCKCPVAGFAAIPVRNWGKLENFLKSKDVKLEVVADDLWKVACPYGKTVFAKKAGDWLLLSDKECGFAKDVDFAKYICENTERVDVGFTVFVANIPDKYKELAVEKLAGLLKKCAKKHLKGQEPSEAMVAAAQKFLSHVKGGLLDLDRITYGHCWCVESSQYVLSVTVTAKEGTATAKKLASVGAPKETNFAGFRCPDATFVIAKNGIIRPLSKDVVNEIAAKHAAKAEKKIAEKAGDHADAALAFFKKNQELILNQIFEGNIDSVLAVKAEEDNLVVAGARYVPDGYAWEGQFKQVVAFVKEKCGDKLAKKVIGSGTFEKGDKHIYWAKFALPEKLKGECREKLVKALGGEEIPVSLVFGPKAIYFAAGKDAGNVLRTCIQNSAEPKALPTFSVQLSAMDVLKCVAACGKCPKQAELQKAVEKIGDERGLLFLETAPAENGFKLQFRATTSAIKMMKAI